MMIHFSTYSIYADPFWMNTLAETMIDMYYEGDMIGSVNGGGTSSCTFVEDGDASFLKRQASWEFTSFALPVCL